VVRIAALIALVALGSGSCSEIKEAAEPVRAERQYDPASVGLEPMANWGPYETLDEVCASMKDREGKVRCEDREGFALINPEFPYRAVQVIRVRDRSIGIVYCELAIEIERGWYVTENLFICDEDKARIDAEVINLELVPQKSGPSIVRAEMKMTTQSSGAMLTAEELSLCGVGNSGDVSCTGAFSRYEHVLHPDGDQESRAATLTLSRFGVIKLGGNVFVDGDIVPADGAYPLTFP
jgi:hypothetical protein